MQSQPRHQRPARGFSLIELMVVVGIIALLAGITFTVIGGALEGAKQTATQTTIAKVDQVYQQMLGGIYRDLEINKEKLNRDAGKFLSGKSKLTDNPNAAKAMVRKEQVEIHFPQYAEETWGFDGIPNSGRGDRGELQAFRDWSKPPAMGGSTPSPADSSELMYLIVTESTIPGAQIVDNTEFSASELADTDNDGWTEIVDAWGYPLRFYRWPTRLINPWGYVVGLLSSDISAGATSIPLGSGQAADFDTVLSNLTTIDPSRTIYVAIGDEIIEVNGVSGDDLSVVSPGGRGAQSTDAAPHSAGTLVKLAPFPELASLLLGSVNTSVMSQDNDDLFGALSDPRNLRLSNSPPGFDPAALIAFEARFHTFSSYAPALILSVGPDGDSGLMEPSDTVNLGHLAQPKGPLGGPVNAEAVINGASGPMADNLTNHVQELGN